MTDIDKVAISAIQVLRRNDQQNKIPTLRKLHSALASSCNIPSDKESLVSALLSVLFNKSKSLWHEKLLCMKILQVLIPLAPGTLQIQNLPWDESQVSFLLPPILNQITCDKSLGKETVTEVVRWISTHGYAVQIKTVCLSALSCLIHQNPNLISPDDVNVINAQFCDWLKGAELRQAPNPYSHSFFKKEGENLPPVTEIDASVAKDFFTALCIGQYYTSKQILNIHSFSLLRQWLLKTSKPPEKEEKPVANLFDSVFEDDKAQSSPPIPVERKKSEASDTSTPVGSSSGSFAGSNASSSTPITPSKTPSRSTPGEESMLWSSPGGGSGSPGLRQDSPVGSTLFGPSSSGRSSPSAWSLTSGRSYMSSMYSPSESGSVPGVGRLQESSLHYSLRIIKQAKRKAKVNFDHEVQKAALIEAIGTLDQLYACEPNLTSRILETIKSLCSQVSYRQPRVLIVLVQFLLNHHATIKFDPFPMYELYFDKSLSRNYNNPAMAIDTVMFLTSNLEILCYRTNLLFRFFPSILKILAWDAVTYIEDFKELLPAFMSPTTAIELLHVLLDLPCLTACLEVEQLAKKSTAEGSQLIEAFQHPTNKPLFSFVMRSEAGFGDTIDRLEKVYGILSAVSNLPRVIACAKAVPQLLEVYFQELKEEGDKVLCGKLIPIFLERSSLLIDIPEYKTSVKEAFCKQILSVLKQYPSLVGSEVNLFLDFVSSTRNIVDREDFFTHVIYVIGEYLSPMYDSRNTPDVISSMYETLEALCYEMTGLQTRGEQTYHPRLLTVLMSTIAKLSSRSQDLIPRSILCLTKLGQTRCGEVHQATLSSRATHLINLLKLPNVAAMILSPSPEGIESGRWHRSNDSMPMLLHTTAKLVTLER